MRYFDRLHPFSAFIYFLGAVMITMMTRSPVIVSISFLFSMLFYYLIAGGGNFTKSLLFSLPVMLIITLSNPVFSHKGATPLFFVNNVPVTAESLIYGFFSSLMILAVFYWMKSCGEIIRSDKAVYLFGKVSPALSLTLSMAIEGVNKVGRYYREIEEAQKGLGIYSESGIWNRMRSRLRIFSSLITVCLERAAESAGSMLSRGYGLPGRSSAQKYPADIFDICFGAVSVLLCLISAVFIFIGGADSSFYPRFTISLTEEKSLCLYLCVFALFSLSVISETKENIKWHYLRSKI